MINIEQTIVYRNFEYSHIFYEMGYIINGCFENGGVLPYAAYREETIKEAFACVSELVMMADSFGLEGNLYHAFLAFCIANNENSFSMSCEMTGHIEGSVNNLALHDFAIFKELYEVDIARLDEILGIECFSLLLDYKQKDGNSKVFNKRIRDRICDLAVNLSKAGNVMEFYATVVDFYKVNGVGKLGLHKAFRVMTTENGMPFLSPVISVEHTYLSDLVGYEIQKKKLVDNTVDFLEGREANNVLLYGDSGTGKSSSIKAVLNEYYDKGLRMIEVYKHQFRELSLIIEQVKDRNYKFVIYMDDLSFEDYEIEYKYLKAIIEGGLSKRPKNVLIYATSNRRHLVREKWSDKEDRREDLHTSDTVEEKLSLVNRFGVTICYTSPSRKQFQEIINVLADKHNVKMSREELLAEANKWEISHGGLSGRTAQQFINYILGQEGKDE